VGILKIIRQGHKLISSKREPARVIFLTREQMSRRPGAMASGFTDTTTGNMYIVKGLSIGDLDTVLRHEKVHSVITRALPGKRLRSIRQSLYNVSPTFRATEEALAHGYATRSIRRGLRFPFDLKYATKKEVLGEAGIIGGSVATGTGIGVFVGKKLQERSKK
jgi:hypothetical protein